MFLKIPAEAHLKAAYHDSLTTNAVTSIFSGFSPVRAQQVCQLQKEQLQDKKLLICSPARRSTTLKAFAVVLPVTRVRTSQV